MLQAFNPKNKDLKVWINGTLYHRDEAKVSVFDSVVQGGDAVWEGIRVYEKGVFLLDRHLDRLFDSAHALAFEHIPTREEVINAISETLIANKMDRDTHIRLTLSRGRKLTSGMDPRLNIDYTLVVLAEWKPPVYDNESGINIITSSIRRNSPMHLDSKIHHNNLLNNILAKIQANVAGADAALMLDAHGFVSELNGTNIFMIKNGIVYTPHADACLPGITRAMVIEICREMQLKIIERNLSLTEFYTADFVFTTGSMGELTPVTMIDGRVISRSKGQEQFNNINHTFEVKTQEHCHPI